MDIDKKDYAIWALLIVAIVVVFYLLQPGFGTIQPGTITTPPKKNQSIVSSPPVVQTISNVSILAIVTLDCDICNGHETEVEKIRNISTFNVVDYKTIDYNSSEAESYISRYQIAKFPTLLISKEANSSKEFTDAWLKSKNTIETDGMFVLRNPFSPYIANGTLYNVVHGIEILHPDCEVCDDYSSVYSYFSRKGIYANISSYNSTSPEGQIYLYKYNITKLPTMVFYPGAEINKGFIEFVDDFKLYLVNESGFYIFRKLPPAYFDLTDNKSKEGIVTMVGLDDKFCKDCYSSLFHRDLMAEIDVFVLDVAQYDINDPEGYDFVRRYNISIMPTALFSEDLFHYPHIAEKWHILGSEESDGWKVFRNISQIRNAVYINIGEAHLVNFTVDTSFPLSIQFGENRKAEGMQSGSFTALVPRKFSLDIISGDNSSLSKNITLIDDRISIFYNNGTFTVE